MAAGITDAGTIGNATAKRQQATDNVLLAARRPSRTPTRYSGQRGSTDRTCDLLGQPFRYVLDERNAADVPVEQRA